VLLDGRFDDGFAATRLAHKQAQPALVAVHLQHIEDLLLVVQQTDGTVGSKGIGVRKTPGSCFMLLIF
jgi:hypothetical protein